MQEHTKNRAGCKVQTYLLTKAHTNLVTVYSYISGRPHYQKVDRRPGDSQRNESLAEGWQHPFA